MAPQAKHQRQPVPTDPTTSEVAQRAYELFEARGGEHGGSYAYEDWLKADEELRAEHEREAKKIEPAS